MNIIKLPADHIASRIMVAIRDAESAGEFISCIKLDDDEFQSLINEETVKNTTSKWYGSNEGGMVLTNIKTAVREDVNGNAVTVPVLAYFNGVKIVRG